MAVRGPPDVVPAAAALRREPVETQFYSYSFQFQLQNHTADVMVNIMRAIRTLRPEWLDDRFSVDIKFAETSGEVLLSLSISCNILVNGWQASVEALRQYGPAFEQSVRSVVWPLAQKERVN